MSRRLSLVSTLLLLTLTMMACGGDDAAPSFPSAADLRVTDQREIKIDGTNILSLSPDGRWLAVDKYKSLCIHQSETLAEQFCTQIETGRIGFQFLSWAPDSSHIAFTEEIGLETDVWILEVESGELVNLTQDDLAGKPSQAGTDQPPLDFFPVWSPDSQSLLFGRLSFDSTERSMTTTLYRVSIDGGSPEQVAVVSQQGMLMPGIDITWLWSSDGDKIFYLVTNLVASPSPTSDLWRVESDGGKPERISSLDAEKGPILMDVSARGKALVVYPRGYAMLPDQFPFATIDLNSGQATPVKTTEGSLNPIFPVEFKAILAPDGSKILYTYSDTAGTFRLAVRDLESETENVLLTYEGFLGLAPSRWMGLDWAENDTLYVGTASNVPIKLIDSGLLLKLESD